MGIDYFDFDDAYGEQKEFMCSKDLKEWSEKHHLFLDQEDYVNPRLADGVLAQPTFLNRGINYRTSTTVISVIGNGFADIIPRGRFITLSGLERIPGPGAQFR